MFRVPAFLHWLEQLTGLSSRMLLSLAGGVVLAALGAAGYWTYTAHMDGALLRADPELLASNASLMRYALPRGASTFREDCAQCHGQSGTGDPGMGVANLTDNDWLYGYGRVSEIRQTVMYGIRSHDPRGRDLADMPAYAQAVPYTREKLPPLAPDDINDVISFLYVMEGKSAEATSAQRGAQIFRGRGGCWDCHGNDAHGDNAVGSPNLTDNIWLYGHGSRQEIFRSIAYGHRGVCPAWVNRLSPARILEVSLYVFALSHNGVAND
jgi:cytochrome c oxidase cbb3-type subunit 3